MSISRKSSPSMIRRFAGRAGRNNLFASISGQQSVAGNAKLASRLISCGLLIEIAAGKKLTGQGDSDNDIYFIVSGSVGIIVNGREIAVRAAGTHVGEMALLDPTARRSATIKSRERTVVLKVPEPEITRIADTFPAFWRRLAVELGARLRERSKYIIEPNSEPIVFVGSSSEAIQEANCVVRSLSRHPLTCHLWTQGVFQLSRTTIEDLFKVAGQCDFGILLLTPDDMTASRGRRRSAPRDNVVFELGLFMGALGRERTFIVAPHDSDLKLPTDLLGVTHAPYRMGSARSLSRRLRSVNSALWKRIGALGPK